ncbi:MAG: ABC transporter ATP-binding protein [Bdellovibrionales bacterium]
MSHFQNAIEIQGLTKLFPASNGHKAQLALDHIDLKIPRGSLFGLIGPNGAGKSTLINILAGLVRKSAGEVWIWDANLENDPRRASSAIGIVPQELNYDPFFTPYEILETQAGLYGVAPKDRITDLLLEMMHLTEQAHRSTRELSGGMKRRLMIAKALVHRPPIVVLDEPTAGVDVELRQDLWEHILRLQESGTTILLTTHYIEEAEKLCDHIAIMHEGHIIANDTKEALLAQLDKKRIMLTVDREMKDVPPNLRPHGWVLESPHQLSLSKKPEKISLGQMLLSVQVNGLNITDIVTEESDLEDVFLQMTANKTP